MPQRGNLSHSGKLEYIDGLRIFSDVAFGNLNVKNILKTEDLS